MSGKPLHLAVWSEWGCFTEPQVNVCPCSWHLTVACLEEQVALSVFQCCSSMDLKGSMCFNVIRVTETWNSWLGVFLWSVFKCVHKAYKQFRCKCWSFTCTLNFNSSFFILHLFSCWLQTELKEVLKRIFLKCEMRNIFRLVALGNFSGACLA